MDIVITGPLAIIIYTFNRELALNFLREDKADASINHEIVWYI